MEEIEVSEDAPLQVHRDEGVLVLTLNRPHRRNALSIELYQLLVDELEIAAADPEVRVVVLTGAGPSFCTGGDVKRMADPNARRGTFEERVERLRARTRIVELLHGMDKPSIAMMRGFAVGAGMSLALACDLRFGDPSTTMRTGFLLVGLSGDFGGHYFLPRIVGPAKAKELYLLSSTLGAEECLRLGLLNRLCEPQRLHEDVMAAARTMSSWSAVALAHVKRNLETGASADLEHVLNEESWRHVQCTETSEHGEALRALTKRSVAAKA